MRPNPKVINLIKAGALFLVGGIVLGAIGIFLWKYPTRQVQGYRAQIDEKKPFDKDRAEHDREMLKLENELRGNYAQIIGGVVLLVGLYLTWRKQNHEERTANQTLRLTEDGKITERYSKAIELLGSDNPAVRIGGIYALERIARDSEKDHWTVMEALCAFIRDESNKVATTAQAAEQPPTIENGDQQATDSKNDTRQPKLRSDIQIALTVIGRRSWVDKEREQGLRLDLSEADLSGAYLIGADLGRANLSGARLTKAHLSKAKLYGADLDRANLSGADLIEADLTRAKLWGADLSGAKLSGAHLIHAQLIEADLTWAYLVGADLSGVLLGGAKLWGSRLTKAKLTRANLTGADLSRADLSRADLIEANLTGAKLSGADLSRANLTGANLTGADLSRADLIEAKVTGSNLYDANLSEAKLIGALFDVKTQFAKGFNPARLEADINEGTQ